MSALKAFTCVNHLPHTIFFDSADRTHPQARYSYILFQPEKMITFHDGDTGDPFNMLRDALSLSHTAEMHPDLPPFQGGAAGVFSYDLGRCIEDIPGIAENTTALPLMHIGIYNRLIAFDHEQDKAWIIVRAKTQNEASKIFDAVNSLLRHGEPSDAMTGVKFTPQKSAPAYKNDITKIIEYIKAGDIFQANLSQRFEAVLPEGFCPIAHYLNLRAVNPAPFAAYMNLGNIQISSASPEEFLNVDKNGHVITRPIKGTAPRSSHTEQDEKNRTALENSTKDRAENTMIVDLLRNDLSRVCTPESVNVAKLCALESFASVHHLVSTVTGTLSLAHDTVDLIRACFPGGSITGAPKIRAMEIIEELEPSRRGAYCGSIGYIGYDGTARLNILIRTLVFENGRAVLHSGGGITAQSNPDDEYQETLDKARAMWESFT